MDRRTALALNRINGAFYGEGAEEFREARSQPWPGWIRLLALVEAALPDGRLDVLDVGCGHGRFAAFLAQELPRRRGEIHYLGVDASPALLARAGAAPLPLAAALYRQLDFVESSLAAELPPRGFALAVLFGVLHHVPGAGQRRELLRDCAGCLRPGGLLAFTAWRFETFARFRDKFVPWETFNRSAREPIDTRQLEPGDHLLPWGERGERVRYCHFSDDDEIDALLADLPVETLASYTADGREGDLNRYRVLRRRAE